MTAVTPESIVKIAMGFMAAKHLFSSFLRHEIFSKAFFKIAPASVPTG